MSKIISFFKAWKRNGLLSAIHIYFQLALMKARKSNKINFKGRSFFLRNKSSDIAVFRQIMIDGDYDIRPDFEPKVIVDLGANVGISALHFSDTFKSAKVIALE